MEGFFFDLQRFATSASWDAVFGVNDSGMHHYFVNTSSDERDGISYPEYHVRKDQTEDLSLASGNAYVGVYPIDSVNYSVELDTGLPEGKSLNLYFDDADIHGKRLLFAVKNLVCHNLGNQNVTIQNAYPNATTKVENFSGAIMAASNLTVSGTGRVQCDDDLTITVASSGILIYNKGYVSIHQQCAA